MAPLQSSSRLALAVICSLAVFAGSCDKPADAYVGKWRNASGVEEFEFLSEGTVTSNIPMASSGHWNVTDDGRLVANFPVMGSSLTLIGCRDRNMLKLHASASPNSVDHLFRVQADGSIDTRVQTMTTDSAFSHTSNVNAACPG